MLFTPEALIWVNPTFVHMMGTTMELLLATEKPISIAIESEKEQLMTAWEEVLTSSNTLETLKFSFQGKDGNSFPARGVFRRTQWENSPVLLGVVHPLGLSSRKVETDPMLEADFQVRSFREAPVGLFRGTSEGTILDCNDMFCRILGYSSIEEVQKTSADQFYLRAADRGNLHARLQEEKSLQDVEVVLRKRNGRPVAVKESLWIQEESEGEGFIIEGIMVESTSRGKVLDLPGVMGSIISQIPLPTLLFSDLKQRILDVNDLACDIYGYSRTDFLKMNHNDLRHERQEGEIVPLSGLSEDRIVIQRLHRRKDGTPLRVTLNIRQLVIPGFERAFLVVVLEDS